MNISITRQNTHITYRNPNAVKILEFLFLAYLVYSLTAGVFGISIPYLAGGWLSILAAISFINVDWKKSARIPMLLILAISASFLFIQIFIFEIPLSESYMWSFVMWTILAAVILTLSERPGFIKRLAVVMFSIGCFLQLFVITKMDIVARQRLDSGSGIDNANDYAAWMGFCALVFWLWSWKSKNQKRRFILLVLFAVATYFLLGTVSRGALICLVAGIIIGFRDIPKRRWLWIILFLGLAYFAFQVLSSTTITNYEARLSQESGRLSRWPIAIESFQLRPIWGYGVENVAHKGAGIDMTPHNGILFLGLAAGVLPTLLFVVMWGLAILRSYKDRRSFVSDIDALPLIIFAFLEMLQGNTNYMYVWSVAALFYCFRDNINKDLAHTYIKSSMNSNHIIEPPNYK